MPSPDFFTQVSDLAAYLKEQEMVLDAQLQAGEEEFQAFDAERAAKARSGESGPEWRRLQRRIDFEETTLDDILSGKDETADAEKVRAIARSNFQTLRQQWELDEGDDDVETSPLTVLTGAQAESAARFEAAAQSIRAMLADIENLRNEKGQ